MINNCTFVGRMTRDFEVQTIGNGSKVSKTTIAVDRDYKDKNNNKITDFIPVEMWGVGFAEKAVPIFSKGDLICAVGAIQIDKYEKEGVSKISIKLASSKIKLLESKKKKTEFEGKEFNSSPQSQENNEFNPSFNASGFNQDDFIPLNDDEDLPF